MKISPTFLLVLWSLNPLLSQQIAPSCTQIENILSNTNSFAKKNTLKDTLSNYSWQTNCNEADLILLYHDIQLRRGSYNYTNKELLQKYQNLIQTADLKGTTKTRCKLRYYYQRMLKTKADKQLKIRLNQELEELVSTRSDSVVLGRSCQDLGFYFSDVYENYKKSTNYYQRAHKIGISTKDSFSIVFSLGNIAFIYRQINDLEGAIKYAKKARKYLNDRIPESNKFILFYNLSHWYIDKHLPDSALQYINEMSKHQIDSFKLCTVKSNYFLQINQIDSAHIYLQKAINVNKDTLETDNLKGKLGRLYEEEGKHDEAIPILIEAIEYSELISDHDFHNRRRYLEALLRNYFYLSDSTYVKYLPKMSAMNDSIIQDNIEHEVSQAKIKYETEITRLNSIALERENRLQQLVIKRRNSLLIGLSVGLIGLLASLILLAQKRQKEKELFRNSVKRLKSDNANLITKNLNLKKPIFENQEFGKEVFTISDQELSFNLTDIIYIASSGNYVDIFLEGRDKAVTVRYALQDYLQDYLNQESFCRIHRQYVVNLNRITKLTSEKVFIEHQNKIISLNVGRKFKRNAQEKYNTLKW